MPHGESAEVFPGDISIGSAGMSDTLCSVGELVKQNDHPEYLRLLRDSLANPDLGAPPVDWQRFTPPNHAQPQVFISVLLARHVYCSRWRCLERMT